MSAAAGAGGGGLVSTDSRAQEPQVRCHLDLLLAQRGLSLVELSEQVGISVVNLSVLKNDRARAVRFTTLVAVCTALGCQPGDLLSIEPDDD